MDSELLERVEKWAKEAPAKVTPFFSSTGQKWRC